MKLRYEVKVIGLWLLAVSLITLGCIAWNNTTLPLVLSGAVAVLSSERVIGNHEA